MSWKWPHQKRSPAIANGVFEEVAHHARIGVADRIGEAHAVGAGVEQRLQRRSTSSFSTRPCSVQPNAVPTPPSISVFDPAASRAARIFANFGDDLVGRLAQVGEAVGMARRQRHEHQVGAGLDRALRAFEIGHEHRDEEPGERLRVRDELGRCRRAAAGGAAERTSRPRSRAGRRRRRRGSIRACDPWRGSS